MAAVPLMWAQSKEQIIITFEVTDSLQPKIDIDGNKLKFSCSTRDGKELSKSIELFKDVIAEEGKLRHSGRDILYTVKKKSTDDDSFWPRLTKDKIKDNTIKVDFNRWKDESDDEYGDDFNFDGDMSSMMAGMGDGGLGGLGGMGGMDGMGGFDDEDPDSDDEDDDMPDLEDANKAKSEAASSDDAPAVTNGNATEPAPTTDAPAADAAS